MAGQRQSSGVRCKVGVDDPRAASAPALLLADGAGLFPEHVFLNFTGCCLWQFLDEDVSARNREVREVRASNLPKLLCVRRLSTPQDYECVGCFPPSLISPPDYRYL